MPALCFTDKLAYYAQSICRRMCACLIIDPAAAASAAPTPTALTGTDYEADIIDLVLGARPPSLRKSSCTGKAGPTHHKCLEQHF